MTRQEAVRLGRLIVVSQPDDRLRRDLTASFANRVRRAWDTNHFHVFELWSDRTLLIHPLSYETIDADLFSIAERELGDAGVVTSASEYDQAVIAIVASVSHTAQDERLAWRQLCLNTLAELHRLLKCPAPVTSDSHIAQFAAIYKRVMELHVGNCLLDVGTSFGFLPILTAARDPTATVVGCDLSSDALACATDLAVVAQASRVKFLAGDVLAVNLHWQCDGGCGNRAPMCFYCSPVAIVGRLPPASRRPTTD
jgi:hypothetical protein